MRSSGGARFARRFLRRAFALVFICATLVCALAPALTVDAADTRPYIGEYYGVTREKLIKWLRSHEHDRYYLGTPYGKLAYTAPNGDPYAAVNPIYPTGGVPRMNCAGFVAHVVYKCGLDTVKWNKYIGDRYPKLYYRQSYNIASADMWYLHVTGDSTGFQGSKELTGAFRYYSFPSVLSAVASGKMHKGDLFIFWPTEGFAKDRVYSDSHIGIYWGDYPGENKFWHMHWPYCEIGQITYYPGSYNFIVIPLSPAEDENNGTLTVTESRADDGKGMVGAKFTVTNESDGTSYSLGPTGSDGVASISIPNGIYTVTQTAYPAGYGASGASSWRVRIEAGRTTPLNVKCAIPNGTLEIRQTDQNGKGLAGAAFTAVRKSDGKTVRIRATDASGKTSAELDKGTYTVTQTAFPPSYTAKGETSWTVKIESGKTATLTTVAVPSKGAVRLTVVDSEGEGVGGVYYAVRDTADLSAKPIAEIMTDVNGVALYGLESGKYTIEHGKVLYLHYEKSAWDSYIPDTLTHRVTVCGGAETAVGGGEITLASKSAITLSSDIPEGEYAIYTDENCGERAKAPNADLSGQTDALISGGEELTIAAGTYWLRLNEDISKAHDGTTVTYSVEAKALCTSTVEVSTAVTREFTHHFIDAAGESARNERGFVTHVCSVCGEQVLFGDVNGDGALNARDVTAMMRSHAGYDVVCDEATRDMNGDGKFNARDVIALMRVVMAR